MTFNGILAKLFLFICLICFSSCHSRPTNSVTEDIPVDDFSLLDQNGHFHELYYYSDKKGIVLISEGVGCPIVRQSIPYLLKLKNLFQSKGVQFFMLDADPQDDRSCLQEERSAYGITMPILEDRSQMVTESLGIKRTAEAVIINPLTWTVVYHGPISSQFGYETRTFGIQHEYLKDAIQALLENRTIEQPKAKARGCLINMANSWRERPSYNKDVVPILTSKCLQCHVQGGIAPWSMDNFAKIKGWSAMMREVLRTQRMPPWQADPNYGKFKGDFSLSDADRRTLINWIEQGAVNDEQEDLLVHAPRLKLNGWILGQPDLIFRLKEQQQIPANGADQFRFIEADQQVVHDLWVKGIYWRPSNLKVVHHGNLVVEMPSQQNFQREWFHSSGMDLETGQVIDGYSPGTGPFILPQDTGFFIPQGARIFFRMHYIPTGKPEQDTTQVGLYVYKNKPSHILSVYVLLNRALKIPPGAKGYKIRASHVFKEGMTLYALQPHMHYRGRSMRFSVEYPNGKSEILLSVPNYKFRWQHRYVLKEPKKIPPGSRISIEGTFDNSPQNPDNPDPTQEVTYGPLSTNEMFVGILYYVKEGGQTADVK